MDYAILIFSSGILFILCVLYLLGSDMDSPDTEQTEKTVIHQTSVDSAQAEINALKAKINALKAENNALKAENKALKAKHPDQPRLTKPQLKTPDLTTTFQQQIIALLTPNTNNLVDFENKFKQLARCLSKKSARSPTAIDLELKQLMKSYLEDNTPTTANELERKLDALTAEKDQNPIQQERDRKKTEELLNARYREAKQCFERMKTLIPKDIQKMTKPDMIAYGLKQGLKPALACRFLQKRILQCIILSAETIPKSHPAEFATTYDLASSSSKLHYVELLAIYYVVRPVSELFNTHPVKREWFETLETQIKNGQLCKDDPWPAIYTQLQQPDGKQDPTTSEDSTVAMARPSLMMRRPSPMKQVSMSDLQAEMKAVAASFRKT